MVRKIIQIGDPILLEISEPVKKEDIASDEIQGLIDDLIDTCNSDKDGSAGLSAVQIGVLKRVFVARRVDLEAEQSSSKPIWEVMINPTLKILDKSNSQMWEGCLSIGEGDKRLFGPVKRPTTVEVTYLDRNGKKQTMVASDYMSHVIQHENDHLDGKLFLSYVGNPENIWKSEDLDKYIDYHDHYPAIV